MENRDDLIRLGIGHHFGEWWGRGIQRGYNQINRRFSLFNVSKWNIELPYCCNVVPVLYKGPLSQLDIGDSLALLREKGSFVAPGYPYPEGIVIFHEAGRHLYKVTLEDDEKPKGKQ
jgi:hypothetical protein